MSEVLLATVEYDKYDADATLPAKFGRLIDKMGMQDNVKGRSVAIKMHVGRGIGYTTVHPLFIKILVDRLKGYGAKVFITDQVIDDARLRGYTEELLGCPIVEACGVLGKYYYEKKVDFRTFKNVDVAGHIYDADVLIDLSHVKGHGACGYGGACKNLAMGCVTDRTRQQIHGLEGGISWNEELCIHCELCINSCNHNANSFTNEGKYDVFFHHCTYCQHCVKVCPTGAIKMDDDRFADFQKGMAIATKEVLDCFDKKDVYYINFLLQMTALCDCWGFSSPSLVPDIGICASRDIVAIERACLDLIKVEDFNPKAAPVGHEMGTKGHLLERLHYKNPFIQLEELERIGLGSQEYELVEVK